MAGWGFPNLLNCLSAQFIKPSQNLVYIGFRATTQSPHQASLGSCIVGEVDLGVTVGSLDRFRGRERRANGVIVLVVMYRVGEDIEVKRRPNGPQSVAVDATVEGQWSLESNSFPVPVLMTVSLPSLVILYDFFIVFILKTHYSYAQP